MVAEAQEDPTGGRVDEVEVDLDSEDVNEPSPDDRLEEHTLGSYRLWFKLAKGGMATVYLATTESGPGGERVVAVKCIHDHLASEQAFVDMFLDEARIASRIRHPNVCSVFDYGQAGSTYYLAMEYLLGESLQRLMRGLLRSSEHHDPRLAGVVARIIADASRGLHAAHELTDAAGGSLNVVHRDVSPHNLYITYDGDVRVVDFGVASAKDRVHKTEAGKVKGKFAYMSPEQLQGHKVDRRTDVWALGVVLWEALTMRRLFRRRADVETMYAVLTAEVVAPSKIRSWVPKQLDDIVLRALERDPDQRYASAADLADALEGFLRSAGQTTRSRDVAEWMGQLFPGSLRRKRELVAAACRASGVPPEILVESTDPTGTGTGETVNFAEPVDRQQSPRAPWFVSAAMVIGSALVGGLAALVVSPRETVETAPALTRGAPTATTEPSGAGDGTSAGTPNAEAAGEAIAADPPSDDPETLGGPTPENEAAPDGPLQPSPASEEAVAGAETADGAGDTERQDESGADEARAEEERARVEADGRRDQRPNRRRRVRAATGTVNVVTPGGWAEIYHRGRKLGISPLQVDLPVGRQSLELRPFGTGQPRTVSVEVTASETERVRLDL